MTAENIGWDPLRIELLWDLKEPSRRGPKPTLTVEQIARIGVEIADEEGLAALSMQRLADRLGVGTMSLYTYIPDKDSLLDVMFDLAFEETTPVAADTDWREFLTQAASKIMAAYERHPWALQIFIGGPPLGPIQLRFLESALQALSDTGLDGAEQLQILMSFSSLVRGAAHLSVGVSGHTRRSGLTEEELQAEYNRAYARVLDPEEFPAAFPLLASPPPGETESEPDDFGFWFGLNCFLDGIGQHIEAKADAVP